MSTDLTDRNGESRPIPKAAIIDALFDAADDALFVVGADGIILRRNDIARDYTPDADDDHARLSDHLLLRDSDGPVDPVHLIDRALSEGREIRATHELEARLVVDAVEVDAFVRPIGTSGAVLVRLRRADERRRFQREMRRIQHAQNVLRAVGGVTMELAGSCTALLSHFERLAAAVDTRGSGGVTDIDAAADATRRIRKLALQLGNFAGVPTSEVSEEGTSVEDVIHESASLALNGSAIRTSFFLADQLPAVMVPREELMQVLYNVLVNAVDATDEAATIHIEAHEVSDGSSVAIRVRDEGSGMDPQTVDRVTDPYFTTKPYAAGMGLTVAVSILERYGGTLRVETDPGFGTVVTIDAPVAGLRERRAAAPKPVDQTGSCDGAPVLLVEDDPLVRRSMQRTLEAAGCVVVAVESGDRAISVFRERASGAERFRLVITDLMMPGRNDGVQLVRRLREYDPDLPAVLSSGALHTASPDSYHAAGFQYILRKPFGDREVRSALTRVLGPPTG